jgi:hypothetical protein
MANVVECIEKLVTAKTITRAICRRCFFEQTTAALGCITEETPQQNGLFHSTQ